MPAGVTAEVQRRLKQLDVQLFELGRDIEDDIRHVERDMGDEQRGEAHELSGRKSSSDAKRWYATKSIIREIPVMISGLTVVI